MARTMVGDGGEDESGGTFKGIVECHHWLYAEANILHGDISPNDLMFQWIKGKLHGVLLDFDLAKLYGRNESSCTPCPGTTTYMARELLVLEPPVHLFRHDLELFLYVLVFLTCNIGGSPLEKWRKLGMVALTTQKLRVLTDTLFPTVKTGFEKHFGL
ncbi:hypothetical protein DFH06DRAFT_1368740 [Mycena polygramma]|nr:hypothetical protein DFH06DRAFT_1368740 [Mycena polygramma]